MNVLVGCHGWIQQLQEFNGNNVGRLALIETDDSDAKSARAESYYFLREIAYVPRDHQIQIVLDVLSDTGVRVTHTIRDPLDIALRTAPDGRDTSLWVGWKGGQTLLRLY